MSLDPLIDFDRFPVTPARSDVAPGPMIDPVELVMERAPAPGRDIAFTTAGIADRLKSDPERTAEPAARTSAKPGAAFRHGLEAYLVWIGQSGFRPETMIRPGRDDPS